MVCLIPVFVWKLQTGSLRSHSRILYVTIVAGLSHCVFVQLPGFGWWLLNTIHPFGLKRGTMWTRFQFSHLNWWWTAWFDFWFVQPIWSKYVAVVDFNLIMNSYWYPNTIQEEKMAQGFERTLREWKNVQAPKSGVTLLSFPLYLSSVMGHACSMSAAFVCCSWS